jgi:glycogen(starch) synthase
MIERLLVDDQLRDRLVTEASEHVLRFDWDDIAERTRGIYDELAELAPREGARRG